MIDLITLITCSVSSIFPVLPCHAIFPYPSMSDCSDDSELQEPEEEIVLLELTENNLPDFKLLAQAVLPVKYSVSP